MIPDALATTSETATGMLKDPSTKYRLFEGPDLAHRTWPSKKLSSCPRWLSTDLRDGNQSLANPMSIEQKRRYFDLLVELGYKEIEVSYPSSGSTDYGFTRDLIESGAVPDDVWIQVMAPCKKDLIDQTLASVRGAKNVILHLYLATASCFQQVVFGKTPEECTALAVECTAYCRALTKDNPASGVENWVLQFSPEHFTASNMNEVITTCNAIMGAWQPSQEDQLIFNLTATAELSTPNIFADQVEYFCNNISDRGSVVVSLHPHNDRGCAVASTELGQLAGAERVEGTLFGNGERTGNVDLVTLALNLYTQGISPQIDFSHLEAVAKAVESATQISVHARWPYAGSLVTTAFSGVHQDAIKKGLDQRTKLGMAHTDHWYVPYLPWDPQDFGRSYDAVIRVNSQSGKGGMAWILQQYLGVRDIPRHQLVEFAKTVQSMADMNGRELSVHEICELFEAQQHPHDRSQRLVGVTSKLVRRDSVTAPTMKTLTTQELEVGIVRQ